MYHESVKMLQLAIFIFMAIFHSSIRKQTSELLKDIKYKSNNIAYPLALPCFWLPDLLPICALAIPYSTTRTVTVFRAIISFPKKNIKNHNINKYKLFYCQVVGPHYLILQWDWLCSFSRGPHMGFISIRLITISEVKLKINLLKVDKKSFIN